MPRFVARMSGWVVGLGLVVLIVSPLQASTHDKDPVFFFVSDELIFNEGTIEEICIDRREGEKSWLILSLKPEAEARFNAYAAEHVGEWLVLVAGEKVIIKSKIMPGFELGPPLLVLSADSDELFDLLRNSFGIDEPQICKFED